MEQNLILNYILEQSEGNQNGISDNGILLTTRFGKRNPAPTDIEVIKNKRIDGRTIEKNLRLLKNTGQDLKYKMYWKKYYKFLEDYLAYIFRLRG